MGGKDILLKRTKKQKTRTKKRTKNQEKKQIGVSVKMVLVLFKGRAILGAKRWLNLGLFNIQPSEPMKLALILTMARYLAAWEMPGGYTLRELFRPLNVSRPLGALALLVVRWPKLGAANITVPKVGWVIEGGTMQTLAAVAVMLWLVAALF